MLFDLTHLETITYRAALAFHFTDSVTGQAVTDSMRVRAWAFDSADPMMARRADEAEKSLNSGVYGFRVLPGLEGYQIGEALAAGSLAFLIRIEDGLGRYLPQIHRYDLPLAQPAVQEVTLFPAPDRPTPSGYATIRGQLLRTSAPAGSPPEVTGQGPARWAQVTVTVPPDNPGDPPRAITGQADGRGTVVVMAPYPIIASNILLNAATWTVSAAVAHEPTAQDADYQLLGQVLPALPEADEERRTLLPPLQTTLGSQGTAALFGTVTVVDAQNQIYRIVGPTTNTSLNFTLAFGRPLTLRAQVDGDPDNPLSEFLIQSA